MSYSVVDGFGDKCYFENSIYQSLDNKVMAHSKTYSVLWLTGVRHRDDGPAVEYANGNKEWYYHGKHISCKDNQEFLRIIKMIAFL
tara:strand:+ start:944 stop:1201 length:258 start_codon:yes stop_codon:yes gene_type:complete